MFTPNPFTVQDETSPESNRVLQPTNPWLLDEVADLISKKIDDCGEPDDFNEWDPDRYAASAAHALLREGLITLRPGPLPTPSDIEVEQSVQWLAGLIRRATDASSKSVDGGIWPRDAGEAQRVINVLNALRGRAA